MSELALKAFDMLKSRNLVKEIISYGNPIIVTITKDVPYLECIKIYNDKLDLKFGPDTFVFDLVDREEYSIEDIIDCVDDFFDERISLLSEFNGRR